MRQSIAAILIAGVVAQQGAPNQYQPQPAPQPAPQPQFPQQQQGQAFPGQAFVGQNFPGQGAPQMQAVPQMQQMQGVPQLTQGQTTFTLPAGAQGLQQGQQVGMQLPQQAQAGLTTASLAPRVKGIPIGTTQFGVTDSDRACKAGVLSACGLPDVPNMWNEDPNKRYQTQQSDQLVWQLYETGNYAANGQRVANQNPAGIDIPYYETGKPSGNFGAVYTVNANDPFRRPVNSLVNYVTNDNRAPEGFRPSASNAVLPSSSAYMWANANPQATTPVNTVTGAGFGYSDKINAPGTSPVYMGQGLGLGQNWNLGNVGQGYLGNVGQGYLGNVGQGYLGNVGQGYLGNVGQGYLGNVGQGYLGNVGQNLGYFGNQGYLGGVTGLGNVGQNWNLGGQNFGQGFMAPRSSNLGYNLNFNTGLRPGGAYGNYMPNAAPATQNRLPTLPNGMTTAPAWTPTTGTGYNGPNVAPQQGQQPQPRWP